MARTDPQLIVRLPIDLKTWVEDRAAQNGRSQNAEVVQILKQERERCERQAQAA